MACAKTLPEPPWYRVPRTVIQLMRSIPEPTISASVVARSREVAPTGAAKKVSTPASARGTATRNPASASEGNGTATPFTTSYQDQMTSPIVQESAESPRSHQPRAVRPLSRRPAHMQASVAANEAPPSPRSSTAVVSCAPPILRRSQARNTADSTTDTNTAAMNARRRPREVATRSSWAGTAALPVGMGMGIVDQPPGRSR
jgi:hypothetical protein